MAKFNDNTITVFNCLKDNYDKALDYKQIAEMTGIAPKSVTGIVTGLQKKLLVERVTVEGRDQKVIQLTTEGLTFDPTAEVEVEKA